MVMRLMNFVLSASLTAIMIASLVTAAPGQSGRGGRFGAAGGRVRAPVFGRSPVNGATVIPNRGGGFTMHSPQGTSRYLGKSQGNKVFHPDGTNSIVIPDIDGGATVYGPQGNHRVFPDPREYEESSKTR